jgi:hypothetical protein
VVIAKVEGQEAELAGGEKESGKGMSAAAVVV